MRHLTAWIPAPAPAPTSVRSSWGPGPPTKWGGGSLTSWGAAGRGCARNGLAGLQEGLAGGRRAPSTALGRHPAGTGGRGHDSPLSSTSLWVCGCLWVRVCALTLRLCLFLCLSLSPFSGSLHLFLLLSLLCLSVSVFLPHPCLSLPLEPRTSSTEEPKCVQRPPPYPPLSAASPMPCAPMASWHFRPPVAASVTQSRRGMMANLVDFASLPSGLWGADPTPAGRTWPHSRLLGWGAREGRGTKRIWKPKKGRAQREAGMVTLNTAGRAGISSAAENLPRAPHPLQVGGLIPA